MMKEIVCFNCGRDNDITKEIKKAKEEEQEHKKNLEREFTKLLTMLQSKYPEVWEYYTSHLRLYTDEELQKLKQLGRHILK